MCETPSPAAFASPRRLAASPPRRLAAEGNARSKRRKRRNSRKGKKSQEREQRTRSLCWTQRQKQQALRVQVRAAQGYAATTPRTASSCSRQQTTAVSRPREWLFSQMMVEAVVLRPPGCTRHARE